MKCKCGGKTTVTMSIEDGRDVLRQRKCLSCGKKVFTKETIDAEACSIYKIKEMKYK